MKWIRKILALIWPTSGKKNASPVEKGKVDEAIAQKIVQDARKHRGEKESS